MPLYDSFYYDQKWSLWDTVTGGSRNLKAYVMTAARRITRVVTTQNRRTNVVTTQNRRSKVVTSGG